MKNLGKISLLTLLLAMGLPSGRAQDTKAVVTRGEKATLYVIPAATNVTRVTFSPDARYLGVCCPASEGEPSTGFIYDFERDTTWATELGVKFMASPDRFADESYLYNNGEIIEVESRNTVEDYETLVLYAASKNMDTLYSMSYELVYDPNGQAVMCPLGYLIDGHTGKIITPLEPHWPMSPTESNFGFMVRPNAASEDGMIIGGISTWPGCGINMSPVFWDLEHDTSFSVADELDPYGSVYSVSPDGTILGDMIQPMLYFYDRENLTIRKERIPYEPSMVSGQVRAISNTGLCLVLQEDEYQSGTNYIYDINTKQLVRVSEYVEELYGLEAPVNLSSPTKITADGSRIYGRTNYQGAAVPWCLVLDDTQILSRPRSFSAMQFPGQLVVSMTWRAPLQDQFHAIGYNVFCDSVQVNTELIPVGQEEFLQTEGVEESIHEYAVQAVYPEGVSAFSESVQLMVVGDGGCFPVQEIGSQVVYNRYVDIWWGLPSSQMHATASTDSWDGVLRTQTRLGMDDASGRRLNSQSKSYMNENLDVISYDNLELYGFACGVAVNNRLFAGAYESGNLYVFNMTDMSVEEVVPIQGASSITNMVYLDGELYLATETDEILVFNVANMSVGNRIKTISGVNVLHLSYIPELDGGNGGFAYGDVNSLLFCTMRGKAVDPGVAFNIQNINICGTAYYDGKLYMFSQSGKTSDELYTFDFTTGQLVGKRVLSENPRLGAIEPTWGFIAGGLSLSVLPDSTIALGAMLQFQGTDSHIAFLELESSPSILGYVLYRNNEPVLPEGEYIHGLSFSDTLMEAGDYTYTVKVVNENGCENILPDVKTTVVISPIDGCSAPSSLKAVESNASVMLGWEYESGEGPSLVGFDIYRDDELVVSKFANTAYTDCNLAPGSYLYRVEAFHNNSCVAADSIQIEVTLEGKMMPPAYLTLDKSKDESGDYAVEMNWGLPYYEEPLALGYCGLPYDGTCAQDGSPLWVLIGWDSVGLNPYRDLYIVGMEFFIGEGVEDFYGTVFVNKAQDLMCSQATRVLESEWNTMIFPEFISMDQPVEALVGYKVSYTDNTQPVAVFDAGPGVAGYGDLLSTDGQQWTTL